ncbi:MAG: Ig-like domain-containing protein [Lachnospiraceae bacterium]|nr:Ig-like domain-containing protein [Lachnospiraceae bacterium]
MFAKVSKKVVAVALVAAMAVTTATVSDGTAADAAKKIKLNKKTVSVQQSKSVKLKANQKAKWTTSNKAVATVSKKSAKSITVKAIKPGSATITATAGGKKATCKVTVTKKVGIIYNLKNETGSDPSTGESYAPPCVCKYSEFKYNNFRIWLCRMTFYDPANAGTDYRGRKLKVVITVKNSGKRDLPELGVCFNYTKGGTDGAYPFALHVSAKKLSSKVKKDKQHRHTTYKVQKIKKGKTYKWTFNFTIPSNAMNGDKDQKTGINYPIMMYIPNMKDTSPYKPGDEITVKDCKIYAV